MAAHAAERIEAMTQPSIDISSMSDEELDAQIKADDAAAAVALAAYDAECARRRKENRAVFGQIERRLRKVRRKDLAIVWCTDGQMAVVQKADELAFEKFELAKLNGPITAEMLAAFVNDATVVHPAPDTLEALWADWPEAKLACANAITKLMACNQKALAGKD